MKQEGEGSDKGLFYRIWKSITDRTDADKGEVSSDPAETVGKLFETSAETSENQAKEELEADGAWTEGAAEDGLTEGTATEDDPEDRQHSPSDAIKLKRNYLEALRSNIAMEHIPDDMESYFSDFTYDGKEPDSSEKVFIMKLQKIAKGILELQQTPKGEPDQLPEQEPGQMPEPVNAQVCVKVAQDEMSVWLFAFPPENGGKGVTEDLIMGALHESDIKRGFDEAVIQQIARRGLYLKLALVAVGKPAVDGTEGKLIDHYPRIERQKFEEHEDMKDISVDYKELNWIHQVSAGDVICDLIFPINGEDGFTVTGQVLKAYQPKKMNQPNWENIILNKEKNALISKITGTMFFEKGRFHVKDVLNIMSDVDLTVGNIDTVGNLEISGDVLSGFSVKATGNINIRGMVGNSIIIAGGDIKVGMGVRGCGEAVLKAGGTINCIYMENCIVQAKGAINSGSIINCNVISDDSVVSKKIVGGSIGALYSIAADTIGIQQRHQTSFSLGISQQTLEEKTLLENQSKKLENSIAQTEKSIRFLESKEKADGREEVRLVKLIEQLEQQQTTYEDGMRRLEEIKEVINQFSQCELTAKRMFPPVTVMIRSDSMVINDERSMCRIWSDDGEIRMS